MLSASVKKKSPGVNCQCLEKGFKSVFLSEEFLHKNSLSIYTPDEVFKCKRGVCFSKLPLVLESFPMYQTFGLQCLGKVAEEPHIWGICGRSATRANELEDEWFLLCYKIEKRFISQAILHIDGSSVFLDVNKASITQLLDDMRTETKTYSQHKKENKHLKRAHREARKSIPQKMKRTGANLSETLAASMAAVSIEDQKEEEEEEVKVKVEVEEEEEEVVEIVSSFSESTREPKMEEDPYPEMDSIDVSETASVLTASPIPDEWWKESFGTDIEGLPTTDSSSAFIEFDDEIISSPCITYPMRDQVTYTDLPYEWDFLESSN